MDELDLPALRPYVHLPLSKVGTTARLIPISLQEDPAAPARSHLCSIEMYTNLPANRRGVHLSRFSELLEQASEEVFSSLQGLAIWLAERIGARQNVEHAMILIRMPWVRDDTAPVTGLKTKKAYQVSAEAREEQGAVTARLGVMIPIILACPCVQVNLESRLNQLIPELGISASDYKKIKQLFPMASHSQRGKIEVWLEDHQASLGPQELIQVVEEVVSVSHDLLKRPDEVEVVYSAHRRPQFCEDVTREAAIALYRRYRNQLPKETSIAIRVTSEESIHSYDLVSELEATLGDLDTALSPA